MTLQVTQDLEYGLICIVTESEKDKVGQMYYFDSIQASILKISEHDQERLKVGVSFILEGISGFLPRINNARFVEIKADIHEDAS